MAFSGFISFLLSTLVLLEAILHRPEAVSEETGSDKPLNEEDLVRFGHLGKLGEQGEILRGEIDELDYFPNGKDFYDHFIRKRRPLIMRGVSKQWPAFEHWKNESYMRKKYGDVLFEVDFTKRYEQKFPIKKTLKLNEFFDIYQTHEVYLDSAFPQSNLTKDIPVPYCLQCEELSSRISSIHLLYSSGDTTYVLHQDGYENLLAVLSGTKVLLIANSSYSSELHSDEYLTVPGLSPVDPEKVDLKKYPRVAGVPFHEVVLEAGDVLYNPQLWWHQVRSYNSPNIAVSLWFSQFKVTPSEDEDAPDYDVKIVEVAKHAKLFEDAVELYPKSIACRSQNKPLGSFFSASTNWNTPSVEKYKTGMTKLMMDSGYEIPLLGFGTGFLSDKAKMSTLTALKTGYRLVDTAVAYENEEAVGDAIVHSGVPREEVVIVDKIHPKDIYKEGALIEAVESSLKKLKVDYIDVMMLHAKDCEEEEDGRLTCKKGDSTRTWEDGWKELETTVLEGKVRSIGVSNFEVDDLKRLLEIAQVKPSIVQNLFDPFIQDIEVRDICQENNIVYMGFSTLGRSWFDIGFDKNPVLTNPTLLRIAADYDASVPQVVLRWAMWEDVVTIPRSSDPNHIALNFASQYVPLNEQDIQLIRDLQGQINEDDITKAMEKTFPEKDDSRDKAKIIENPSIVVEREVNLNEDIALYFGSDDHWIYALDGLNGQLLWKHQTADETGSVCATNDDGSAVYCGADDKQIRAFYSNNGSLIWKFEAGDSVTSSVRLSDSGDLLFGCLDNHIYCVSPTGELHWKRDLGDPVWATPALAAGGEVVFIGGLSKEPGTGTVFALHGESGSVVWSSVIGGIFASPAVDEKRNIVVFCTVESRCYGNNVDSGESLWILEVQSEVHSSPTIQRFSGLVFIACLEGTLYAVQIETGVIEWKKSVFIPELRSSPLVLDDGRLFLASGGGMVQAVNSSNADVIWSKRIDDVEIFSSPKIANNGMLYIGTIAGAMVALNASTGDIVWRFNTKGAIVATVRISGHHVAYTGSRQQFNE